MTREKVETGWSGDHEKPDLGDQTWDCAWAASPTVVELE